MPDRFARTVASLDTPGGQVLVYLVAMCLAAAISQLTLSEFGRALIYMFAGAMVQAMRGKGAENHDLGAPQAGARIPAPPPDGGSKTESTVTTVSSTENKGDVNAAA